MKKRLMALALAALMLVTAFGLVGCGKKDSIIGTWKVVGTTNEEAQDGMMASLEELGEYGEMLLIIKKDSMSFDLDLSKIEDETAKATAEFAKSLFALITITYKDLGNGKLEITMDMMGEKETAEVEYKLDGKTLIFDGAKLERVK